MLWTQGITIMDSKKDILFLKWCHISLGFEKDCYCGAENAKVCKTMVKSKFGDDVTQSFLESNLGPDLVFHSLWIKWHIFAYLQTFFLQSIINCISKSWSENSCRSYTISFFRVRKISSNCILSFPIRVLKLGYIKAGFNWRLNWLQKESL